MKPEERPEETGGQRVMSSGPEQRSEASSGDSIWTRGRVCWQAAGCPGPALAELQGTQVLLSGQVARLRTWIPAD